MMKHLNRISLMMIATLLALTSCSKYEEGPLVSMRQREARVANLWQIERATSGNEDITESFEKYELQLSPDGNADIDAEFEFFGNTYKSNTEGTWEFTNDDENIRFDFDDDDFDGTYRILKLTENEMIIKEIGEELELELRTK